MRKINTIIVLAVLVILLPFLGFPQSWDNFFYIAFGLVILGMAYLLRVNGRGKVLEEESPEESSFSNNGQHSNTTST